MGIIAREEFVDRLTNAWGNYVARFQRFSPGEQRAFVEKQGYARFADLLGHIIAWWQDGARGIAERLQNPDLPMTDYDVDAFNALAVQRFSTWSEAQVLDLYEIQRCKMLDLVRGLSDEELNREKINLRLYYEILMHWAEHEIQ